MQQLDVEVVCNRQELIYRVSVHQVDALAWLCSELAGFEPENINLDTDPDPGVIKALATRGLVVIDAEDIPQPTAAGLAVAEKVDQLYRQGRKYHGLKDAAMVARVQASGKSQARRGPRVERSDDCEVCGVERTSDNDKYWRRTKCNPCYQKEKYYKRKAQAANEAAAERAESGGDLTVGQAPLEYERKSQPTAMLSVRLGEDDYYLFTAITAIAEQTNAGMVREFIQASASDLVQQDENLTLDGLKQTGKRLFEHAGKKFKRD